MSTSGHLNPSARVGGEKGRVLTVDDELGRGQVVALQRRDRTGELAAEPARGPHQSERPELGELERLHVQRPAQQLDELARLAPAEPGERGQPSGERASGLRRVAARADRVGRLERRVGVAVGARSGSGERPTRGQLGGRRLQQPPVSEQHELDVVAHLVALVDEALVLVRVDALVELRNPLVNGLGLVLEVPALGVGVA